MEKIRVFIDGNSGTTGLRINERLEKLENIELLSISPELRKDPSERARLIRAADIAFLCLPDDASREICDALKGEDVKIIDTSTAHRTDTDFAYGFAELSDLHRSSIAKSNRVAVPGCHASGFIAIVYPLVKRGIISADSLISCFSLTGYSGGGKAMIADYEKEKAREMYSPKLYGLSQQHKHLKEMKHVCSLENFPAFFPIVDDYYSGMAVTVPLFANDMKKKVSCDELFEELSAHYASSKLIKVKKDLSGAVFAGSLSGYDNMELIVSGNDERMSVTALFDNLGKGASGAAVQCMNIMLGFEETLGLDIKE